MRRVLVNGRWPLVVCGHQAPLWERPDGWEVERLAAMSEEIGPAATVLYVGAEQGDMPALLAMWGARVHLFEPGERVWANIRAVWEANGIHPAGCFAGFAYDVTRDAVPSPGWPPAADGPVVADHGFRNFVERPEVPAIRLDDYCAMTGAVPTDVSMDVEGSEWPVLRGAERVLVEHRPRLWVSIHPTSMWTLLQEDATEMHRWVRQRGYVGRLLSWRHEMHMLYLPVEVAP